MPAQEATDEVNQRCYGVRMHIQCVLDALMLSMKRWARFPRSWTGYAPPSYFTAIQLTRIVTHAWQGDTSYTAYTPYSDTPNTPYIMVHFRSGWSAVGHRRVRETTAETERTDSLVWK